MIYIRDPKTPPENTEKQPTISNDHGTENSLQIQYTYNQNAYLITKIGKKKSQISSRTKQAHESNTTLS